jgi:hypothetical protein
MPAQYKLTMKPKAWSRSGDVPVFSGPVFLYEVEGAPNGDFQIMNTNAEGKEPNWRVHNILRGTFQGDYKTPEEALGALEQLVNQ